MQKARIKLASTDIKKINQTCDYIKEIAEKTGVELRGPIPLPTKKLKLTTRKSPCGEGTNTWDRLEVRIYKRIIDLISSENTLKMINSINIEPGVEIEVTIIEEPKK